jgi:large subunit ribosomal protein L5
MAEPKKADNKAPSGKGGGAPGARPGQAPARPKGGGKGAPAAEPAAPGKRASVSGSTPPRIRERFRSTVVAAMMKERGYENPFQVPRLEKVVINMGVGEGKENAKVLDFATADLQAIAGQKPVITRAKKSIANFRLREGMPIGVMVTLRGQRMYEFYDRLVNAALPRIRDFRGCSVKAFDGRGNYSLGVREQLIFPEIDYDKVDRIRGMQININTSARNDEEGKRLLELLGMPFERAPGSGR